MVRRQSRFATRPEGRARPADVIGNAVHVMRIATVPPLRRATASRYARSVKRHHWLMLIAVLLFGAGWLVWNAVLVEQDVATPPAAAPPAR